MKNSILLLAFILFVSSSCTTAYQTGQTPDDVYYSAAKPRIESDDDVKEEEKQYTYDDPYYDDRYLRMKVRNRYRWNELDDWYVTDRYSIGYNYYYGSFNNPFNRWNYYYNPFCCCLNNYNYVFVNPKAPASPPVVRRYFNLAGYTNTATNLSNNNIAMQKSPVRTTAKPVYNNSNNNSNSNNGLSNKIRTIFSNDNTGGGSSRTYTPSSSSSGKNNNSSSGSSGKSGSSSGGVSRPGRN
jgi:hypothetical protein